MKKFLIFLLFIAIIAGGAYIWWQQNAHRIITEKVQVLAKNFFLNPEHIKVQNDAVKLSGLNSARVPKMVITGNGLQLKDGPALAYTQLVLKDIEISGPPFHITRVGSGSYVVKVTDSAVTEYLHARKGNFAGLNIIPLNTVKVHFQPGKTATAIVSAQATVPIIKQQVPMIANGQLVPSSTMPGQVDFRVDDVKIERFPVPKREVRKALSVINPVVDLSSWPVTCNITSMKTRQGEVILNGTISGVESSILP